MIINKFADNSETWDINNLIEMEGDVELDDEDDEEYAEDAGEEEHRKKEIMPDEKTDIFNDSDENMSISECF
jgi:hypothetical protein